ncbi:hypothetical protein T03_16051 [Trichinella britovi]|nr:hypothetical protein T05_249 [Trichinella murrelli]KRX56632.1 hypothetical protein T09_8197 [Trichinella sp. T9]KRY32726.1 hypothetical protein T01_14910 [Trichinella spiralis]KRY54568.1 hypothetical protein T03_16051 [Trichinella britovi]KRZ84166.1 hypothetical protein T08_4966 [Trichinella sp. T8]
MRRRNWTDQPGNGGASLTTSFNVPVSVHLINFLSHVLIIGWQVAKPTPDLFTDIRKASELNEHPVNRPNRLETGCCKNGKIIILRFTKTTFSSHFLERKKIESIPTYLPIYLPACHIPHN